MGYFAYLKNSDNEVTRATVSVETTILDADTFPEINVKRLPVCRPLRIRNELPVRILLSFPADITADLVAIVGHNLTENATISIKAGSTPDCSDYSTPMTARKRTAFKVLSSAETYRYWMIDIDDEECPGAVTVGYMVIGQATTLGFSFAEGWRKIDLAETVGFANEAGGVSRKTAHLREQFDVDFRLISETDLDTMRDLFLDLSGDTLFVIPDVDENDGFFGRFNHDELERVFDVSKSGTGESEHRGNTNVQFIEDRHPFIVDEELFSWRAGESLPSDYTFSRSSTAYYKDKNLKLVQAASGEVRSDHWFDENRHGLLLEVNSENLIPYSEAFDDAAWIKTNVTVAANATDAPDGNMTADEIIEDATSDYHYIYDTISYSNFTDNQTIAGSVFVKRGSGARNVRVLIVSKANRYGGALIDPSDGSILDTYDQGSLVDYYVEKYADDWWRIHVLIDSETGTQDPYIYIGLMDGTSANYTGDGSSSIYIFGAQLENLQASTSYIPTSGAPASRAIEILIFPFHRIVESLSVYLGMIEIGQKYLPKYHGVFSLTASDTIADPRCELLSNDITNQYILVLDDGTTARSGNTILSNSLKDLWDAVCRITNDPHVELETDDGVFQLSNVAFPGVEWGNIGGAKTGAFRLNDRYTGATNTGVNLFTKVKIVRGCHSLAVMRREK